MPVSLLNSPEALSLSRQPLWYRYLSDDYRTATGAKAKVEINIPLNVVVGSVFTLIFNQHRYSYICIASGSNNTGYQFKTYSSNPSFDLMVDDFKASYYLNRYYTITSSYAGNKIILEAKESGSKWNVTIEGATGSISLSNIVTGTNDTFQPNYKAVIDVHLQDDYTAAPAVNLISTIESDPHQDSISPGLGVNDFVMDFDISEIIHAQLSPHIPLASEVLNKLAVGPLVSWWHRIGEVYGTDPIIHFNEYNGSAGSYKQAIIGGWKLDDNYSTSIDDLEALHFLNRQERIKIVSKSAHEYLYKYLVSAYQDLQLSYKIYYTDGTNATGLLGSAVGLSDEHSIYVFPCGFNVMGLNAIQPLKTPVKYEVFITDDTSATLSEVMTFVIDHRYYAEELEFLFLGQCGAMETVWCTGYKSIRLTNSSIEYQAAKLPWYTKGTSLLKHSQSKQSEVITVHTGYKTRAYIEWLRDLAQSDTVLMLDGSSWAAVRLIKKSIVDMPTGMDDLFALSFEIERIQKL
jgi:hypothetical protein